MAGDVLLNKVAVIERCLGRVESEYIGHQDELETNYTRQDSIILNLQRACEASIDAAMHLVRVKKLGVPQESREAFDMLSEAGIIAASLCDRLKAMVGFRNVAVHDYRKLNLAVVRSILETRLNDFRAFGEGVLKAEA
ncbi:MAG: DUF86 domain-containing protein [Desulfuromonadales bacterium]|nr:MAG: DUF86 domain-containing protein [Desulfuromonadales bacterium]